MKPVDQADPAPDMSCDHEPPCRYFWRPCKPALLCSQCGEMPSVMVKIGTTDGWCTRCLDEAADPSGLREAIEARIAQFDRAAEMKDADDPHDHYRWMAYQNAAAALRADLAAHPGPEGGLRASMQEFLGTVAQLAAMPPAGDRGDTTWGEGYKRAYEQVETELRDRLAAHPAPVEGEGA